MGILLQDWSGWVVMSRLELICQDKIISAGEVYEVEARIVFSPGRGTVHDLVLCFSATCSPPLHSLLLLLHRAPSHRVLRPLRLRQPELGLGSLQSAGVALELVVQLQLLQLQLFILQLLQLEP